MIVVARHLSLNVSAALRESSTCSLSAMPASPGGSADLGRPCLYIGQSSELPTTKETQGRRTDPPARPSHRQDPLSPATVHRPRPSRMLRIRWRRACSACPTDPPVCASSLLPKSGDIAPSLVRLATRGIAIRLAPCSVPPPSAGSRNSRRRRMIDAAYRGSTRSSGNRAHPIV